MGVMSDMCGFRNLDNSASKRVLDLLKPVKLTVWKAVIEITAVVKFRIRRRQLISYAFNKNKLFNICYDGS